MVHITYRHGVDSTEENMVILKEYHFYISDDRWRDLVFVQHRFQLFYKHLEDTNIQMERHWIWSNGCVLSTRGTRCHIFGTILRPNTGKGNMIEQFHASRLHYVGKRWNSQLFHSSKMQIPLLHGVLQWWGRELDGNKTNHLKKNMYIDIFGRWSI